MVRDTAHGWAASESCRPKERACGPTHGHIRGHPPSWQTRTVGRNTSFPSTCGSGSRGTGPGAVGGTGRPSGKTFFLHCQRRHPELLKIPTYLPVIPAVICSSVLSAEGV